MNKERTRQIGEGAAKALQAYAEAEGLTLEYRGGQYGDTYCILKFQFSERDAEGKAQNREAENFRRFAGIYGLKPDDLGRQFEHRGQTWVIEGLNPKARTYPVIVRNLSTNTLHKFNVGDIRKLLERAAA